MVDFNGFDKGVIGKKLPSDTTLNNMRKADLIKLLHLAENNHRVLAETYKIAIDTSKCNTCPLSIDTRRAEQTKADAIKEFVIAYIKDEEQYDRCQRCERMDDYCCIQCFRDRYLKQLKEQNKNENL